MIGFLRKIIHFLLSFILFLLLATFALTIFSPGNRDTHAIFETYHHGIEPITAPVVQALVWPIDWLWHWVERYVPVGFKQHFPVVKAGPTVEWLVDRLLLGIEAIRKSDLGQHLTWTQYEEVFPGQIDYRLLLAIPFWGWVEALLTGMLNGMDARLYRFYLRQQDKAVIQHYDKVAREQSPPS